MTARGKESPTPAVRPVAGNCRARRMGGRTGATYRRCMTTPRVTELPLRMEPMTPDPFLGGETAADPVVPILRDADHPGNDGNAGGPSGR